MRTLRTVSHALGGLGTTLSTIAAIHTAYVAVLGIAGTRRVPRAPTRCGAPSTTFTVLMPAHDEAGGIDRALRSWESIDYPRTMFDVHVVADNCSDHTAEIVRRHGFEAHERVVPDAPGKGPALNWLFDRLDRTGRIADVVVVVDADTDVDPEFLAALDGAFRTEATQVAQGFYTVRDPAVSPAVSFRYAALACRHHVRSLGRRRLGGSCGLYGNGMAFRSELLRGRRWSNHLVEDAEFQLELLLDGVIVEYVSAAVVSAEMPEDLDRAETQQQRWERGRLEVARRSLPRLAAAWRSPPAPRVTLVDAAFDLVLPPLSVLVAAHGIAAALSLPDAAIGRTAGRRTVLVSTACIAAVIAHAVGGLVAVGAPGSHYRSLLTAPRTVLWKTALWARSALPGGATEWVRTRRTGETT